MKMSDVDKFLYERENRVSYQEELLKRYEKHTLVTVKINYPGLIKSNYITDNIIEIISDEIKMFYYNSIIHSESYKSLEGLVSHFIFDDNFIKVKESMISIEEKHILGRFVDLDVYREKNNKIVGVSRCDLSINPRKCFICNNEAKICSRSQTHDVEEIKKYFDIKYHDYIKHKNNAKEISQKLSQIALKAMICEVSTFPSFGLVSPVSNGSHCDMDYYTFIDSSFAIAPYLNEMAYIGYTYNNPDKIFSAIREVGKSCEENMFKVTNNVNTHKGMIFLIGIVIAATSNVIYNNKKYKDINNTIKSMVVNILDDFNDLEKKEKLTHGEYLFLNYGFTGIRGQIKDGLSVIIEDIVCRYKDSCMIKNELYAQLLLELMSVIEDSTIVYRHDINTLAKVQKDAKAILDIGGLRTKKGKDAAVKLESEYINKNISPGGCADLLAVSIYLIELLKSNILI